MIIVNKCGTDDKINTEVKRHNNFIKYYIISSDIL